MFWVRDFTLPILSYLGALTPPHLYLISPSTSLFVLHHCMYYLYYLTVLPHSCFLTVHATFSLMTLGVVTVRALSHLWLSLILFNKSFINYNVERTRWLCDCINLTFYTVLYHWPSTHHSLATPPDWRVANDFCFRCRTVFTTKWFWKGLDCFSASVHVSCFMKIAGSLAIILTVVKMTCNDGWRICPVQTWIPATDIIFRDFLFLIQNN